MWNTCFRWIHFSWCENWYPVYMVYRSIYQLCTSHTPSSTCHTYPYPTSLYPLPHTPSSTYHTYPYPTSLYPTPLSSTYHTYPYPISPPSTYQASPDGSAVWGVVVSTRWWLLVDHCVLRNWGRILVRAVKGLISRAGMVSICPLLWQRDVKLQQTNPPHTTHTPTPHPSTPHPCPPHTTHTPTPYPSTPHPLLHIPHIPLPHIPLPHTPVLHIPHIPLPHIPSLHMPLPPHPLLHIPHKTHTPTLHPLLHMPHIPLPHIPYPAPPLPTYPFTYPPCHTSPSMPHIPLPPHPPCHRLLHAPYGAWPICYWLLSILSCLSPPSLYNWAWFRS